MHSISHFKKDDYLLTFWVQGVSVFVTDIHLQAYAALEVLYIIERGVFKQYFTKTAYEQALDRGLVFYRDPLAFDQYRAELSAHCEMLKRFFQREIASHEVLSRDAVEMFFAYTRKLCGEYAKMNFEYTDKAFSQQEQDATIKRNLEGVATFKDEVRAVMNGVLFEADGYLSQLFAILGTQLELSPAVLENLTLREILALFEGKRPDEIVVSERQQAFVESNDLEAPLEGEEAEEILREFHEEVSSSDVLRGKVASKGNVTGIVKIIPVDYSDLARVGAEIEKMKQGEILVAETTAPELMAACKKAAAIVTDMGGLMSHAAIVSREFGIPCIVGTKNASKILKDGDRVEVDAVAGIVRILR